MISNSSDALEKYRYGQVTGTITASTDGTSQPLGIQITLDEAANTITFIDNGVGMTREELISNLGTFTSTESYFKLLIHIFM